jgi:hypothetical protein
VNAATGRLSGIRFKKPEASALQLADDNMSFRPLTIGA